VGAARVVVVGCKNLRKMKMGGGQPKETRRGGGQKQGQEGGGRLHKGNKREGG
jgi:hypothetical protein